MTSDRRLQINELVNGNVNGNGHSSPPEVYRCAENGREYYVFRGRIVYPFPCDEDENRRLDQFHHLIHKVALKGKLFTADLTLRTRRPQVLDVGHGTGIWALQMGVENPSMDVIGIDLIDNQARLNSPIPNVSFRTPVDFNSLNWGFQDNYFDLIRMSQLCGSVQDWLQQYRTVYRHLKPGSGCIEHIEIDWTPRCSSKTGFPPDLKPLQDWWNAMTRASSILQRPIAYPEDTEDLLMNAGFTDISHKTVRIPLQSRPKDERDANLKRFFQSFMCWRDDSDGGVPRSFESLSLSLLTRQMSMSPEEVRRICNTLRHTYSSDRWPLYHNIQIWTARKPMS